MPRPLPRPDLKALIGSVGSWARRLRRDTVALWIAARDPRISWHTKLLAGAVAAYALSPIDLIPDFIPVVGYLDDLLIVPAGIWLVVKLIPRDLMSGFRAEADRRTEKPISRTAAAVVVLIWLVFAGILAWFASTSWQDH